MLHIIRFAGVDGHSRRYEAEKISTIEPLFSNVPFILLTSAVLHSMSKPSQYGCETTKFDGNRSVLTTTRDGSLL